MMVRLRVETGLLRPADWDGEREDDDSVDMGQGGCDAMVIRPREMFRGFPGARAET